MCYMHSTLPFLSFPGSPRSSWGEARVSGGAALWPLLLRLGTETPARGSEINGDVSTCTYVTCIQHYHFFLLQDLAEMRLLYLEMLPSDLSCSVWVQILQHVDLNKRWRVYMYMCYMHSTLPLLSFPGSPRSGWETPVSADVALWHFLLHLGSGTPGSNIK